MGKHSNMQEASLHFIIFFLRSWPRTWPHFSSFCGNCRDMMTTISSNFTSLSCDVLHRVAHIPHWWYLGWSWAESAVPVLARNPLAPPRCGSLSIIKVGSARASGPGSFINWITHKINVCSLQCSNRLLPLAEIISAGLCMTAKRSAPWMERFAALHTKWIVHHCLIKRLLETLVSSPLDSKP